MATVFMFAHLVEEPIHKKTTVYIHSKPIKTKDGLCGLTTVLDESANIYKIDLNSEIGRRRQLMTLGHELVHVKQYICKELGDNLIKENASLTKWQGKYFNESENDYWDWPWEIEAHGREYGLLKRWESWLKDEKINFRNSPKDASP